MARLYASILLLIAALSAQAESNFLKLCHAGERNAVIVSHRVTGIDAGDRNELCQRAYEVLKFEPDFMWNFSCAKGCRSDQILDSLEWAREFNTEIINVSHNHISRIEPLQRKRARLMNLDISYNPITDSDLLKYFYALEYVNISGIESVDDAFIENLLPNLQDVLVLQLADTQITSIAFIPYLPELLEFDISGTAVEDLSMLNYYEWFTLGLDRMSPKALASLPDHIVADEVSLEHNNLSDLTLLDHFDDLFWINMAHNHIRSLDPIKERLQFGVENSLGYVDMSDNDIESIESFRKLQLYVAEGYFNLSRNHITDVSPLSYTLQSNYQMSQWTHVRGNPISQQACLKQLADVQDKETFCKQLAE